MVKFSKFTIYKGPLYPAIRDGKKNKAVKLQLVDTTGYLQCNNSLCCCGWTAVLTLHLQNPLKPRAQSTWTAPDMRQASLTYVTGGDRGLGIMSPHTQSFCVFESSANRMLHERIRTEHSKLVVHACAYVCALEMRTRRTAQALLMSLCLCVFNMTITMEACCY